MVNSYQHFLAAKHLDANKFCNPSYILTMPCPLYQGWNQKGIWFHAQDLLSNSMAY